MYGRKSSSKVHASRGSLLRLYNALSDDFTGATDASVIDWSGPFASRFREAMDDDFNTPEAMAALYDLASELNRNRSVALEAQLRALAGVLGLLQRPVSEVRRSGLLGRAQAAGDGLADEAIEALIAQRGAAKKSRDFATADRIRADLLAQGVVLEDSAAGTTWRRG